MDLFVRLNDREQNVEETVIFSLVIKHHKGLFMLVDRKKEFFNSRPHLFRHMLTPAIISDIWSYAWELISISETEENVQGIQT